MNQPVPQVQAAAVPADGWLLDVREPDEWEAGHAPTASHTPLRLLPSRRPPRGPRIVVVCRTGARSARATVALRSWGYDAVNLAGGMQAWETAGLTIVDGQGNSPGRVI